MVTGGSMRTTSTRLALALAGLCSATWAAGQSPARQPALDATQAVQLFEEAGFRIEQGRPVNRCGGASNPRVAFVDLNDDGRAEAHVADVDPRCYGAPGAYFAILAQQADGRWRRLIGEDGIVGFERSRTGGWNDLSLEARDSACPGPRRFDGTAYVAPVACAASAEAATAPSTIGTAPVSQTFLLEWDDSQTPEARALPIAERDRIFRAAGAEPVGGGRWTRCTMDDTGRSEAQVSLFQDVNGDGRPEALVHDQGSFCNGMAGMNSTVLTQTAEGSWKLLYQNQGFAYFTTSRGAENFPDIVAGLPGFCFPYFRWDGAEYFLIAKLDAEGKACEPF
jgi:hypothetical protein